MVRVDGVPLIILQVKFELEGETFPRTRYIAACLRHEARLDPNA